MTRGRVMADLYPTGPIDFHDDTALAADPYLRDQAGRFAPHPSLVVRYEANGAVAISPPSEGRHERLDVARCPHGSFARWARTNCCSRAR